MCWTKNKLNLNVCEQCLLTICVIFIRKSFYEISYEEYVTEESTSSYVQVIVILRFLQVPISTASVALLIAAKWHYSLCPQLQCHAF